MNDEIEVPEFIRKLMPEASEAEHRQALENVRAYLRAIDRLRRRLIWEGTEPDSTKSPNGVRIRKS